MKIFDLLAIGARFFPENKAIKHLDREISYRDLLDGAYNMAAYVKSLNLESGSHIALMYDNSIEYAILFFAISKAGYVAVPLDTSLKPDKIKFIISDCDAQLLFCHSKYARFLNKIVDTESPLKYIISDKAINPESPDIQTKKIEDILENSSNTIDDSSSEVDLFGKDFDLEKLYEQIPETSNEPAAIFYTSGSTGEPKGVMLSHRNLISNTIATVDYLKLTKDDSIIVILPFYYIYGNSLLLTHILVGGTLVIDNRFMYPEVILDTMEKEGVTGFSGVPSNFIILLNNSTMPSRKLKHLRYFTQAGGAMAPEIIKKLMNAFPEKEIYIMYGQTEASPRVSYLPPERLKEKIGSIGIPLRGIRIKVVDENGSEVPVGMSGELITAGDNVMLGYWNQPDDTRQVLKDGWLYTGDLAKMDEGGYYFITGRKKEIIKTGGNRVSAKEVEECLLENEKVLETAVFGVEDEILGEAVKAIIVPRQGQAIEVKEIQSHCRSRMAEHKVPKIIEFMKALPKHKSGKVNKLLLKN